MKQAKTGNAFQKDQKLYQNEKVSEKKKIFEKNQCTAAGELSPPLVKEWKYIYWVVTVLRASARYRYICDDTGLTSVKIHSGLAGLGLCPFSSGLSLSHTPLPQSCLETQKRFKQEK